MQKILLEQSSLRMTRQGVRDLNSLDGRGYNGHRATSCSHYRNPETPTRIVHVETLVEIHDSTGAVIGKRIKTVPHHHCLLCGEKRFDATEVG